MAAGTAARRARATAIWRAGGRQQCSWSHDPTTAPPPRLAIRLTAALRGRYLRPTTERGGPRLPMNARDGNMLKRRQSHALIERSTAPRAAAILSGMAAAIAALWL